MEETKEGLENFCSHYSFLLIYQFSPLFQLLLYLLRYSGPGLRHRLGMTGGNSHWKRKILYVRERERERGRVCVCDRESVRVCVCVREKERERERVCVCERERVRERPSMRVLVREREIYCV